MPPRYGGPVRVFHLARELGREHDVTVLAKQAQRNEVLRWGEPLRRDSDGFDEIAFRDFRSIALYGLTSYVFRCPPFWQSSVVGRGEMRVLSESLASADVIEVEHPWGFGGLRPFLRKIGSAARIVFSAHNVEADLNPPSSVRGGLLLGRPISRSIEKLERSAVENADAHVAVTADDAARLNALYGVRDWVVVPNGVDTDKYQPATAADRHAARTELQLGADKRIAIFVGSLHAPNVEACKTILEVARQPAMREVTFLIVGAVAATIREASPNVQAVGPVASVRPYLQAADLAVNPMVRGSGTNLKQLEFMAAGLPTITTPVGARGLPVENGVNGVVLSVDEYAKEFSHRVESCTAAMGKAARDAVRATHDWRSVGDTLRRLYRSLG